MDSKELYNTMKKIQQPKILILNPTAYRHLNFSMLCWQPRSVKGIWVVPEGRCQETGKNRDIICRCVYSLSDIQVKDHDSEIKKSGSGFIYCKNTLLTVFLFRMKSYTVPGLPIFKGKGLLGFLDLQGLKALLFGNLTVFSGFQAQQ